MRKRSGTSVSVWQHVAFFLGNTSQRYTLSVGRMVSNTPLLPPQKGKPTTYLQTCSEYNIPYGLIHRSSLKLPPPPPLPTSTPTSTMLKQPDYEEKNLFLRQCVLFSIFHQAYEAAVLVASNLSQEKIVIDVPPLLIFCILDFQFFSLL